jgi:hypothetical protein
MPCVGLRTEDGKYRKTWPQLDPSVDWKLFYPATPGILAWLKLDSEGRADVNQSETVSASQIGNAPRRLWLETQPYYVTVRQLIGAAMGTKAHDIIEKGAKPRQICEMRITVGPLSAKNDLYDIGSRTLEDLKHIGWYALSKILDNGVADPDGGMNYVYQVNLWRILASLPAGLEQIQARHPEVTAEDMKVEKQVLTIIPRDLTGQNKKEASKRNLSNPWCVPIDVPFLPDKQVVDAYMQVVAEKKKAINTASAEICPPEKRWDRGNGYPAMCVEYCPVIENCLSQVRSLQGDNYHPADVWSRKKFDRPFLTEVK